MKKAILITTVLLLVPNVFCAEFVVPSQYPTIQAAIDDAFEGDIIIVQPGVYYENLLCDINDITISSTNPQDPDIIRQTVIDAGDKTKDTIAFGPSVTGCLLTGLTITGGRIGVFGNYWASADISHCVIRDNSIGIMLLNGTVSNCLIYRNFRGARLFGSFVNCTIADNDYYGIEGEPSQETKVINCIIWGNSEQIRYSDFITVTYSCVQGGFHGIGNIDKDPLFADAASGDYRLLQGSPCIDAGKDLWPAVPATDLDGNYRRIDGDEDGFAVIDMGAYEYGIATSPIVSALPSKLLFAAVETGPAPGPQKLYISNIGPDSLNWEILEDCPWLSVDPPYGTSAGEIDEVEVTVDTSGLTVGSHTCDLLIVDTAGGPSRAVVRVNCCVFDENQLNVPYQFPTIQAAIDAAAEGDTVVVAPGVYTGEGNKNISFRGKAITVRSIDPTDLWVVDNTLIDCNKESASEICGFVFQGGEDSNSLLDGLTITNASKGIYCNSSTPVIKNCNISCNSQGIVCEFAYYASVNIINCRIINNGPGNYYYGGAGILVLHAEAKIVGCDISNNWCEAVVSRYGGGGIYCSAGKYIEGNRYRLTLVEIIDCNISGNAAGSSDIDDAIFYRGGGIFVRSGPVTIKNCTFTENQALEGGAIYIYDRIDTIIRIVNCLIHGNRADKGGGVFTQSPTEISNSIIAANVSQNNGAGLYIDNTEVMIYGCSIVGNTAGGSGGGMFAEGLADLFNCILWANADAGGSVAGAHISPSYGGNVIFSCIQDDEPNDDEIPFGGEQNCNIDDDPMFVRLPDDGGDGWGTGDNDDFGDLHLLKDSPCIDTGSPLYYPGPNAIDIDGQPRIIGEAVDMGADEYAKMIVVKRPVDNEVWATSSTHKIDWYSYGVNSLDILLSKDGGQSWRKIAQETADAGSYLWKLPRWIDSNQCVISILPSNGDPNVISYESGTFTIKPYPRRPDAPAGWQYWPGLPAPDLSKNKGPELGCVKWVFETNGPVSSRVTIARPENIWSLKDKDESEKCFDSQWHWGNAYKIYVGCEDGFLYALDNAGNLLWKCDTGTPLIGSPAVGHYGMVYVAGDNGWVYAIDEAGDIRWTHITDGPIYSTPVVGYDGKIYACSQDGRMYALAANGSELWTFETAGPGVLNGAIFATPAMDRKTVYIAGLYDPNLYALNSDDGSIEWACGLGEGLPFASPVISRNGTIYQALVYDTNLYAIDSDNGEILWALDLADPCSQLYGSDYSSRFADASGWCEPAIAPDGTIYISLDDPYLRALSPDGQIKWATRLGMVGGFTLDVGADGLIYAASDDGFVCVVNPEGVELSRFEGNEWMSFPVIAPDGTLIVSDSNNTVWALGGRDCEQQLDLHAPADIEPSKIVDYMDLAVLAETWLDCTDPYDPQRCQTTVPGLWSYPAGDIDRDLYVDFQDYAILAEKWLTQTNWFPWQGHRPEKQLPAR